MNATLSLIYVQNWVQTHVNRRVIITFFVVFFISMLLCSGVAVAADDQGPIALPGMGSLFPIPDPAPGTGHTLREAYPDNAWAITSEMENVGGGDTIDLALSTIADIMLFLIKMLVYCIIGMSYWIFGSTSLPGANTGTADMMSSLSQIALTQMLPITLTLAFLVAYAQVRRLDWSTAIWAVLSAMLAIGMMTGPIQVVAGVDTIRQAGMTVVASVSTGAGEQSLKDPIPSPEPPVYDASNPKTTMLRSVEDTVWRQLVATPWCMAQFGSLEACQRFGPHMLTLTSDDARQKYIKDTIYKNLSDNGNDKNQGKDSATGQWIKGEDNGGRIGLLAFNLLFVIIFGILLLGTGLTALVGLGMSYMLLGIGPFFAALWVIEGKPRQWGMGWFNLLVGALASTIISSLLFMVSLNIVGAVIRTATGGWATASMSAIIILFSAFAVKNQVLGLFGAQGVSMARMMAYGYAGQRILGGGAKSLGGMLRGGSKAAGAAARGGAKAAGVAGSAARGAGKVASYAGQEVGNIFRNPATSSINKPTTRNAGDPAPKTKGPAGGNKPSPGASPGTGAGTPARRPAGVPAGSRGPGRRSAAPAPARGSSSNARGSGGRTESAGPRYGESVAQAARRNPATSIQDLPGQTNVVTKRANAQRAAQPQRSAPAAPAQPQRSAPAARPASEAPAQPQHSAPAARPAQPQRSAPAARPASAAPATTRRTAKQAPAVRSKQPPAPATETVRELRPDRRTDK